MVAPIAVHCDGGFPVYGQAVWVKKSVRRYYLLGGDEIAVIEFSPLRGMGVSTQKEEFEEILRSISK